MKKKLGNPEFEYELSCDQMCGKGHYTMRAIVKVVTKEEFILWRAKQKSAYVQMFPDKDPHAQPKIDTLPRNPATAGM